MIVFVILHYLAEDMTVECVEKIEKCFDKDEYHIVIVDNASKNGSGYRLKEKYKEIEHCSVILNENNLGFACGNNVGYRYAKENFNCEFMIIMNNDVLIEDSLFLEKIKKIYIETSFYILGPDILSGKTNIHQNPRKIKAFSKKEVEQIISSRSKYLKYYPIYYIYIDFVLALKKKIKRLIGRESKTVELINKYALEKRLENPVLHGACLIFSKLYIDKEENAFHEGTFLYMEEDILHYTCMNKGYKMIYDSGVSVKHLEDVSTDLEIVSGYRKRKMIYENHVKSAKVLLNEMK